MNDLQQLDRLQRILVLLQDQGLALQTAERGKVSICFAGSALVIHVDYRPSRSQPLDKRRMVR